MGEKIEKKVDDLGNKVEEVTEELVTSENETAVESIEEVTPLAIEDEVEPVTNSDIKKSKQEEAKELIATSKELILKVDSQVEEYKVGVSQAAENFDEIRRTFNNTAFKHSEELLEKAGMEYVSNDDLDEPFELTLEPKDSSKLRVDNISSGRFTGLILAILAALAAVLGWIYLATQKLNIPLTADMTPETIEPNVEPVLTWIGGGVTGAAGNPMFGMLTLAFSALLVAWLVYAIRVYLKANKNLRIAKETFEKTAEYTVEKDDSKREMASIDAHLRESHTEVENYQILLNEQNAILNRVIHVEGIASDETSYHPSSKKVMRDTERLMQVVDRLINTSVTNDGKLNPDSEKALSQAQAVYNDYLGRIYD